MTTCRYINSGQSNFKYEYLGEFETEFKNILGHDSGAQVCSFDGKKLRSKISCYCPFNVKNIGCSVARMQNIKNPPVPFPPSKNPEKLSPVPHISLGQTKMGEKEEKDLTYVTNPRTNGYGLIGLGSKTIRWLLYF